MQSQLSLFDGGARELPFEKKNSVLEEGEKVSEQQITTLDEQRAKLLSDARALFLEFVDIERGCFLNRVGDCDAKLESLCKSLGIEKKLFTDLAWDFYSVKSLLSVKPFLFDILLQTEKILGSMPELRKYILSPKKFVKGFMNKAELHAFMDSFFNEEWEDWLEKIFESQRLDPQSSDTAIQTLVLSDPRLLEKKRLQVKVKFEYYNFWRVGLKFFIDGKFEFKTHFFSREPFMRGVIKATLSEINRVNKDLGDLGWEFVQDETPLDECEMMEIFRSQDWMFWDFNTELVLNALANSSLLETKRKVIKVEKCKNYGPFWLLESYINVDNIYRFHHLCDGDSYADLLAKVKKETKPQNIVFFASSVSSVPRERRLF